MVDLKSLEERFAKKIKRLNRMIANMVTMNEVEYAYDQLRQIVPDGMRVNDITMDFILQNQALVTSFVIAYGRMFASSSNTSQLNPGKLPEELKPLHHTLIELRNQRYAHHGGHPSQSTEAKITFDGEAIVLVQQYQSGMWLGAPQEWRPLVLFWREHIYNQVHDQLDFLTRESGVPWKMKDGPKPSYASRNDESESRSDQARG